MNFIDDMDCDYNDIGHGCSDIDSDYHYIGVMTLLVIEMLIFMMILIISSDSHYIGVMVLEVNCND